MLRRHVHGGVAGSESPESTALFQGVQAASSSATARRGGGGSALPRRGIRPETTSPDTSTTLFSVPVLLTVAVLLSMAAYMFPDQVESSAGEVAHAAYQAEQELEKEMLTWWKSQGHNQNPPVPEQQEQVDGAQRQAEIAAADSSAADQRMAMQDSKWVDGEKKLKLKLKELAERQSKGLDVGVPVLTRYLGEDIPAWAGEGVDRQEWERLVKEKYDQMRLEEEEWRRIVAAQIAKENKG